jgi:hypothetical protein
MEKVKLRAVFVVEKLNKYELMMKSRIMWRKRLRAAVNCTCEMRACYFSAGLLS